MKLVILFVVIYYIFYYGECALTELPKFIAISQEKTWSAAETYCEVNHGIANKYGLASARNASDYTALSTILSGSSSRWYWIALNDISAEGTFKWAPDGGSFSTSIIGWAPEQPNVQGTPGADCVVIDRDRDSKMNDATNCDGPFPFICHNVQTTRGYYKIGGKTSWIEAYRACKNDGSTLASFVDFRDWNEITDVCGSGTFCYIGLNDIDNTGTYTFIDGTDATYALTHIAGGSQSCVFIDRRIGRRDLRAWNCLSTHSGGGYAICNPNINSAKNVYTLTDDDNGNIDDNIDVNDDTYNDNYNNNNNNNNNNGIFNGINDMFTYSFLGLISVLLITVNAFMCCGLYIYKYSKKSNYQKINHLSEVSTEISRT